MHIKEIELNKKGKHTVTRVYTLDSNEKILNIKLVFEYDEYPDLPFGKSDTILNSLYENASFDDAELIDNEYVIEETGISHKTANPNEPYFKISTKIFFNKQKQKIRVEEIGNYENYIQTFTYDNEGYVIEENIDNLTHKFGYTKRVNTYGELYNEKRNEKVKLLKYSKFDNHKEEFLSYTQNGDLMIRFIIERYNDEEKIYEEKYLYLYDNNGNWVNKRHYENGDLMSTTIREYGNFPEYFKDGEENDLPF